MRTSYKHNRRGGYCPGHVRDTFDAALLAYSGWKAGEIEPTVEFEVNYEPRLISISSAARKVWNCTDILPSWAVTTLEDVGVKIGRYTYAAAARSLTRAIAVE
jgi:hypothetical protein